MNTTLKLLLFSTMLALPIAANAADKSSAETSTEKTSAKAEQAAPDVAKFDKQLAEAQKNMQKMQEQMTKINQTQDPQERQKLINEHWATMQSTMPMMQDMMGCCMGGMMMGGGHMMNGMMGGGHMMGWNNMSGYYSKLTPEQMKQRQYMMDQYMGMQNMMMDNMMQHQNWMMQPSK